MLLPVPRSPTFSDSLRRKLRLLSSAIDFLLISVLSVINHPKLKEIFTPIEFSEKAPAPQPPANKEQKKKEEPKPKAEKAPKVKEEEEEEPAVPAEPKAKNPLDDLPKSAFNLEEWKRQYSNLDTRGPNGSLAWFYEKFDKEGFSIWRVDFKYNEELTQVFMSSNQVCCSYVYDRYLNPADNISRSVVSSTVLRLPENTSSALSASSARPTTPLSPVSLSSEAKMLNPLLTSLPTGSLTPSRSLILTTPMTSPSSRVPWLGTLLRTVGSGLTVRTSSKQ